MSKRRFPTDLETAKSLNKVLKSELERVRSEEARLLEENRKQAEQIKALADALIKARAALPNSFAGDAAVIIDAALRLGKGTI